MEANSHHKRVRLTASKSTVKRLKSWSTFPELGWKRHWSWRFPSLPVSTSGYEGCLAVKNLQPQLATAALTMTQGNKSHLDSISVTSLEMMFRWWKMTIKRFVCHAFPADPHYLCLPGLSSPLNLSQHLFNLVPGVDQLAGLHLPSLSINQICPANTAVDLMRSLQSWSLIFDQGCPVGKCTSSNQHSSPPTEHCSDLTDLPDPHQ